MRTESRAMKPKKNSRRRTWRPDLLLTPGRGRVRVAYDVRPAPFGVEPLLKPFIHRPKRPPHPFPPFGLN